MRSISANKLLFHDASIVEAAPKPAPPVNPLTEALEKFPTQLAAALKSLPAPVLAPRPSGAWIIDVSRDKEGKMSQMTAKFHETK